MAIIVFKSQTTIINSLTIGLNVTSDWVSGQSWIKNLDKYFWLYISLLFGQCSHVSSNCSICEQNDLDRAVCRAMEKLSNFRAIGKFSSKSSNLWSNLAICRAIWLF